jgi:hypothetical protein
MPTSSPDQSQKRRRSNGSVSKAMKADTKRRRVPTSGGGVGDSGNTSQAEGEGPEIPNSQVPDSQIDHTQAGSSQQVETTHGGDGIGSPVGDGDRDGTGSPAGGNDEGGESME